MNSRERIALSSRQRGALAVTTPLLVLLILFLTVLLLDGARLYAVKRQMQSVANSAAIAAAGEAQACGGGLSDALAVRKTALDTATANGWDGKGNIAATIGVVEFLEAEEEWRFRSVDDDDIAESNAVGVSYTRDERISLLLPEGTFGDIQIHTTAASRREIIGSFSLSGSTAVVGAGNSVLGTLLPGIIPGLDPVDVTSLESLRNVTGSLGELLVALELNSVEDLLPLSAANLVEGLSAVSGMTEPAVNVIDQLVKNSGIETVKLTDVINIVEASSVPPETEFPLYDTVISLVLNVAEGVLFEFPDTNVSIPDLLELDLSLIINDAPSVLIGPARKDMEGKWMASAEGADISLDLNLTVGLPSVMGLSLANIEVPISVRTGASQAEIVRAFCAKGMSNDIEFEVNADYSGASVDGSISATVIDLSIPLPLLPPISLRVGLSGDVVADVSSGSSGKVVFPATLVNSHLDKTPENGYLMPVTLNGNGQGLELEVSNLQADLEAIVDLGLLGLGGLLGAVEGVVNGVLSPLLDSLVSQLITPLLSGLGVDLGVVTVSLIDARQSPPVLIENIALPET